MPYSVAISTEPVSLGEALALSRPEHSEVSKALRTRNSERFTIRQSLHNLLALTTTALANISG